MKKPEPCPTCKGWCCEHRSPDGAELRYLHMARLAFNHVCPDCETGFVYGPIPTAEDERAAVVAYLRVEADAFERTRTEHGALRAKWLYLTADAIDRGAHCDLKDEKTP